MGFGKFSFAQNQDTVEHFQHWISHQCLIPGQIYTRTGASVEFFKTLVDASCNRQFLWFIFKVSNGGDIHSLVVDTEHSSIFKNALTPHKYSTHSRRGSRATKPLSSSPTNFSAGLRARCVHTRYIYPVLPLYVLFSRQRVLTPSNLLRGWKPTHYRSRATGIARARCENMTKLEWSSETTIKVAASDLDCTINKFQTGSGTVVAICTMTLHHTLMPCTRLLFSPVRGLQTTPSLQYQIVAHWKAHNLAFEQLCLRLGEIFPGCFPFRWSLQCCQIWRFHADSLMYTVRPKDVSSFISHIFTEI